MKKFNKLVLIIPPSPWLISDRDQPMMGALYISSYLKRIGFPVQVCDLAGIPEKHWHIPVGDVYGVTGVTPNFPWMKKIIDRLKEREPNKLVIVGGVHATVLPNSVLNHTKADICVIGEGEETMMEIMHGRRLKEVKGIVTRDFVNPPRELVENLDVFPFPDRDSIDYYDYLVPQTYKYLGSEREGSIITGRGCPYKCSYCGSKKIHKGKVRFRSAYDVARELMFMKSKYDMGLCNFVDDTFILKKKRVADICDYIKNLDIKWFFLTRVDHVDFELFKKMRASGCVSVTFGFESGSNRILDKMKKYTTVKQAYDAIKIAKAAGLKIRGQLMTGLPGETEEDIELTAEFIRNAKEVDTMGLHIFQAYPGCDVWENPNAYGWPMNKYTMVDSDFSNFYTIGKPGVKLTNDPEIQKRFDYLRGVISERNIDKV
jgi:radical SAM superfamily enzyme YgiQ (UPF0313 family)